MVVTRGFYETRLERRFLVDFSPEWLVDIKKHLIFFSTPASLQTSCRENNFAVLMPSYLGHSEP